MDEFDAVPARDAAKLASLMAHYRVVGRGNPSPAQVDEYYHGIKRLRHIKPKYQGRVLFFCEVQAPDRELLVVLTVYKKESSDVPKHILERAIQRKRQYESKER